MLGPSLRSKKIASTPPPLCKIHLQFVLFLRDKTDDESFNLTVKPSAFMTFYKVVSDEEISGREVKLTDELMMTLQLEEQWMGKTKLFYCSPYMH